MDLSTLSDEDLKRLANNDYSKLSDDAKAMFKEAPAPAPAQAPAQQGSMTPQAIPQQTGPVVPALGDVVMDYGVTPAVGAAQTAAQYGVNIPNPVKAGLGYAAASAIAPNATGWGAVKNIAQQGINSFQNNNLANMADTIRKGERFGQDMSGLKQVFQQQQAQQAQRMAAQGAAQTQPGILQRGMDMANKMRNVAAQRVMGAAVVPGAVAAGGYKAAETATNQMANMTPEQRKAYYDSTMMGAMSGDAGLAAAIMNRGQ